MRQRTRFLGSIVMAAALYGGAAHATVMVELTRAELVAQSDLVVRVTVGAQQSRWNEDQTRIITLTHLTVQQFIKGSGPTELTLRQFGGTVGELTLTVPGDGHLRSGEQAVLFLRRGAGVVYLAAMSQSAYEITQRAGATVVRRDLHDVSFVHPNARGAMVPVEVMEEPDETLQHLIDAVTAQTQRAP